MSRHCPLSNEPGGCEADIRQMPVQSYNAGYACDTWGSEFPGEFLPDEISITVCEEKEKELFDGGGYSGALIRV